jgi:hypothetical protein
MNLLLIKYTIQFQSLSLGLDVESEYSIEGNFQFTFWSQNKKKMSFSLMLSDFSGCLWDI